MKQVKLIFVVLLVLFYCSCDKITNIRVEAPMTASFDFDLDSNDQSLNKSFTIDVNSVPELQDYLDVIKDYTIKSVKIEVENFQGQTTCVMNGDIKYSYADQTSGILMTTFTNVDLASLYASGNSYQVTPETGAYDAMSDILLATKKLKIYLNGFTDDVPAQGTIKIIIQTEAKVSIF
ncbi:MAG: hypothetical protein GX437_08845 [Sphingobacteriales bacterium]|nr:hypothetical protein [Sphingobacteriales bacterium]